ncbi:MAG: ATP-binding protein [Clostridia bacterium]|nr:ATP-binding protein [Clostridia bacterium]
MERAKNIREIPNAFMVEPLEAEEMNEFYEETMEIRTGEKGDNPIENIYDACREPKSRNAFLLLGHRGCGKSTELNRLAGRLNNEGYPTKVIRCDMEINAQNIDYTDVLILMGDALVSIANEKDCGDSDIIELIYSFWRTSIEKEEKTGDEVSVEIEAGAKVETPKLLKLISFFSGVKSNLKYNDEKRTVYREVVRKNSSEWLHAMRLLADSITDSNSGKQPILIFEDLDKGNKWTVFSGHGEQLTGVSFPVIYTFPIAYFYKPEFSEMNAFFKEIRMPMVKLKNYDGTDCRKGFASVKEIIKKRADESLFAKGVINLLIEKTGGSLRNLFTAINTASRISSRRGNEKINKDVALIALGEKKSAIIDRIEGDDYAFLADILKGNRVAIKNRAKLLKMMQAGAVLEYKDKDRVWREVHPLVADFMNDHPELAEWNRENEQEPETNEG